MISPISISNIHDVLKFSMQLSNEGLSFHPDDDFSDYMNLENKQPFYSKEDSELRNSLMAQCFEICEQTGVDIYELMDQN